MWPDLDIQSIISSYAGQPDDDMTHARIRGYIENLQSLRLSRGDPNAAYSSLAIKASLIDMIVRSARISAIVDVDYPEPMSSINGNIMRSSMSTYAPMLTARIDMQGGPSSQGLDPIISQIPAHLHDKALHHAFVAFVDKLTDVAALGEEALLAPTFDANSKDNEIPKKQKVDIDLDF
ncbi:hypothetical protein ACQR3P_29080 [Rhodococcus sp. IEGM1300]